MAKHMTKEMSETAPKSARGKAARLAYQRKKAETLLNKWVDEQLPIELTPGSLWVHFMGYLVRLNFDSNLGDFMFKSAFGVSSLVFLLCYDEITVDELIPQKKQVILNMSKFPEDRLRLSAHEGFRPKAEQVQQVCDQFRVWVKLGSSLTVTIGDNMRVSASNCDIKEAGTDTFMLRDLQAKTIHVVFPSESDVIEVDRKESRTGIVLHNRNTNSYISVTDRTESPEEIIQRFPLHTRILQ